ncbi:MAG: hypothetical protein D6705_08550 [Deltaproteobacteria bacterium]|nr:MAG: hypothetical protein D6705_08550 [Deltaproteobacteria bacterium]
MHVLTAHTITWAVAGTLAFGSSPTSGLSLRPRLAEPVDAEAGSEDAAPAEPDAPASPPDGSEGTDAPARLEPPPGQAPPADATPEPADSGEDAADADLDTAAREAAQAYFKGRMAYDTGAYDVAIAEFQRAYERCLESETCHAPSLQFNLAQAYWKRGEVKQQVDDLRRARELFVAYGRTMEARGEEFDEATLQANLAALDAKIEYLELAARAGEGRPVGPTPAELRLERRMATTKGLHVSGAILVTAGALLAATAIGALIARGATKWMLDQAGGGRPGADNQNSPEDDRRLRNGYALSGRVAFGTLIATAVTLPIGITLVASAKIRDREDRLLDEQLEKKRKLRERTVAWTPGGALLTVRF